LGGQCLNRRILNRSLLDAELAAWVAARNGELVIYGKITSTARRLKLVQLHSIITRVT
jgi:hypothetical protein